MAGLVYGSIAELPERLREQAAGKLLAGAKKKETKYHNEKVDDCGVLFDSRKEHRRFLELQYAMRAGAICDLRLQQNFTLIEGFTKPDGERVRPLVYKADFTYRVMPGPVQLDPQIRVADAEYWESLEPGALVIEDTKSQGTRTRTYINKYKMMAEKGYHIREV